MKKKILRFASAAVIFGAIALGFGSPAVAQEAQPEQQETSQKALEIKTPPMVDTTDRFRLFLQGGYGVGFDWLDMGVTTEGDDISISGGGGFGAGLGMGYGISRDYDLELNVGFQVSVLTPAVSNAEGSFTRSYLLGTIKRKLPTSDTGQIKVGIGMGVYSGGKLDVDATDAGGTRIIVKYDDALGFHMTGEFERFITPNLSFYLGGKLYLVKYRANSAQDGGFSVPVSFLKSDIKRLDGSGLDVMVGVSRYF